MSGIGRGGSGVLRVDGQEIASRHITHTVPIVFEFDETFDIGADTGTPIAEDYRTPFELNAKLTRLSLSIDRPKLTPDDARKLREQSQINRTAQ